MTKQLQFNARARYSIKKGVDILTNADRVTIRPKGRNIVVDKPIEATIILNDGVTIARDIKLEELFTNMGFSWSKRRPSKQMIWQGMGRQPRRCWCSQF